jgi:hypothetical protein
VKPALEEFKSPSSIVEKSLIAKINHNAVSHCTKLGVFDPVDSRNYRLTDIGKSLKNQPAKFEDIFREQILKYYEINSDVILFPYREILKLLCEFQSMSYFEFCFAVAGVSRLEPDFHSSISQRFEYVRNSYVNIDLASEKNKLSILETLNGELGTTFTPKDVWTTSTTVANQWAYWRNHLSLFDPAVEIGASGKQLFVAPERIQEVKELLIKTHSIEEVSDSHTLAERFKSKQFAIEIFDLK